MSLIPALYKLGFFEFRFWDLVDILLVAILFFQLYKVLRGSLAFNIFIGILIAYLVSNIVQGLEMKMLSGILSQFVNAGIILLVVIFQPEIRRFLFYLGRGSGIGKGRFFERLFQRGIQTQSELDLVKDEIVRAVNNMAAVKTGALIVFTDSGEKQFFANSGVSINAEISSKLIESLFDKNAPLHDGAVVIADYKILAAGCVLPVSENPDLPSRVGMRHRAAVGITEKIDATVVIVSEETGKVSFARRGNLRTNISQKALTGIIEKGLMG